MVGSPFLLAISSRDGGIARRGAAVDLAWGGWGGFDAGTERVAVAASAQMRHDGALDTAVHVWP